MPHYADARREDWQLDGPVRGSPTSALLPMGGAVSQVAGPNWALIGDAAGCVNPLNGEGIDYGLETGRLVAELIADDAAPGARRGPRPLRRPLRRGVLDRPAPGRPGHPAAAAAGRRPGRDALRALMTLALRWMGNLVTDEDRDLAARVWRTAGRLSLRLDERPPFT